VVVISSNFYVFGRKNMNSYNKNLISPSFPMAKFGIISIVIIFFLTSFVFQACSNPDWKLIEKKNSYTLFSSKKQGFVIAKIGTKEITTRYTPEEIRKKGHVTGWVTTRVVGFKMFDSDKYSGSCPNSECQKGLMEIRVGESTKCGFCGTEVEVMPIYKAEITTSDQKIIENLARNHTNISIRIAAVSKLINQEVLVEIVLSSINDEDYEWNHELYTLHDEAYKKIFDQEQLAKIAKKHIDSFKREDAVKKINDQKILKEIAKNDEDWSVRAAAVIKLEDQRILEAIAKNDEDRAVRERAVGKLEDQKVLSWIAKNDKEWQVRIKANERLKELTKK
jgi:hypothetical protein